MGVLFWAMARLVENRELTKVIRDPFAVDADVMSKLIASES